MELQLSLIVTIYVLLYCRLAECFNVDLPTRIVHRTGAESWFGFSVQLYRDGNRPDSEVWALVGAPRDQSPVQRDIRKGGRVYRCATDAPRCQSVDVFERLGNARGLNGSEQVELESKANQWLGATLAASSDGTTVVACAPRYIYYYTRDDRNGPTGYCYLATNNFNNVEMLTPGRDDRFWGQHRLGYGMFGFSAGVSRDGDKVFMAGPGSWYWQGAISVTNTEKTADTKWTFEGEQDMDNRYMGYATAVGDFDGDGFDDVAVSVPRDKFVVGAVALYRYDLKSLKNISGEQDGSYFGYGLAATDIDGDRLDDIIVGAPFYVEYTEEKGVSKQKYELGKVYVYFQGADHSFSKMAAVTGNKQWSRFGQTVAAAGDLNGDNYNDIVVGAPYDGDNRRGAIYIYHGMEGGMREKHSQVIYAEYVDRDMHTFGFAISAGLDVDGNEYPDMVVGAYKSSHAVILRTNPVVSITGEIVLERSMVDLEEMLCPMDNNIYVVCERFELCLRYLGKGAPQELAIDLLMSFDAEEAVTPRALSYPMSLQRHREQARLYKGKDYCKHFQFYVQDKIRDKLSPIIIEANYSLPDASEFRKVLKPVLDGNMPSSVRAKISIKKDCGPDNECVPDLGVSAKPAEDKLILGAGRTLKIYVNVTNSAEDAYEAQLNVMIPHGMDYLGVEKIAGGSVTCSFVQQQKKAADVAGGTNNDDDNDKDKDKEKEPQLFQCELGNPLKHGKSSRLALEFKPNGIDVSQEAIPFAFNVTSANDEDPSTIYNNVALLDVPFEIRAQLRLFGSSSPDIISYGKADAKDESLLNFDSDIGPRVTHLYQVKNEGPSALEGATLDIYWPSYTVEGSHLLYLLDKPTVVSHGTPVDCRVQQSSNVNPMSVLVDQPTINTMRFKRQADETDDDADSENTEETQSSMAMAVRRASLALRSIVHSIGGDQLKWLMVKKGELNRAELDCDTLNCTKISCDLGQLADAATVDIYVHARLWINTLIDEAHYDSQISSVGIAEMKELPWAKKYTLPLVTTAVTTNVNPTDRVAEQRGIPWWIILIAILAGITLLALLVMLLWRVGFFKRKRPPPRSQATLMAPAAYPQSEQHYTYAGADTAGYAPSSQYDQRRHGPML